MLCSGTTLLFAFIFEGKDCVLNTRKYGNWRFHPCPVFGFSCTFPVCLINVQECPLALEAAEGLLSLGVKGIEVNALVLEGASNFGNMDW
jgi:hypothetical protein